MPSSNDASSVIDGEVALPSGFRWPVGASLRLRIEDVSRVDAAAQVVAELVVRSVHPEDLARGIVPFSIEVADPKPRRSYALRAHLDVDGDGAVSRGDYLSTARVPVLTDQDPRMVHVTIHLVG